MYSMVLSYFILTIIYCWSFAKKVGWKTKSYLEFGYAQAEQETDEVYAQITLVPESNVRMQLPLMILKVISRSTLDQIVFSHCLDF